LIRRLRITVLAENTAGGPDVLAEHGLSFWIEADDRRLLFDTGQGRVLQHNAKMLGVDLQSAESVALSHGHFDHTGGLTRIADQLPNLSVYVHPLAFERKWSRSKDGTVRAIGAPLPDASAAIERVRAFVPTQEPHRLIDGVWLTGQIPRCNDFEDTGGDFYLDAGCTIPDPLLDDQAMFFETPRGLVVLLGCAHAGLVNTLDYIVKLSGQSRIHAVLGGMHLLTAPEDRLAQSIESLRKLGVEMVGASHCTGCRAVARLWNDLADRCVVCAAGSRFAFDQARPQVGLRS
jgi:7,8-dihydropterin-6-yl-methyl-4-(beta-D-ribofuranosyl)aminobenzene 5'-phosphate synthase